MPTHVRKCFKKWYYQFKIIVNGQFLVKMTNSTFDNTSLTSNFQSDRIVGLLFIITSSISLVIYVPMLIVMYKSSKLSSHCYTFMISQGVSDVFSLIGWIIIGIHTITHELLVPKLMITIVLCLLVVGWGSLTTHLAMIAINRYIAVCQPQHQNRLFQKRNMIILLGVSWFYAIFIHAMPTFIPPNMIYSLNGYFATWESDVITKYYTIEDITCCSIVSVVCVFCYSAIIIKYAQVRRQIAPSVVIVDVAKIKERRDGRRQFKLALQTAIRCVTFLVYDLLYYVVSLYSTNLWAVFICSTYLWCFNNALNPWIYLIFNEQLRTIMKNLILSNSASINTVETYQAKKRVIPTVAKIAILLKR